MHWVFSFQRQGAVHGEMLKFVFGLPLARNSGYSENEFKLSRNVITYWSNFASSG